MKKILCLLTALMMLMSVTAFGAETETTTVFPALNLNTVDINGNPVDNTVLEGAALVIVNFWEPWCGPCVSEMPDLEKLYETYAGQGLLVVGIFGSYVYDTVADDAKAVAEYAGVTYPILLYTDDMEIYQTDYVPTTILTDGEGNVLVDEQIIGAASYEEWEALIQEFLQ